MKQKQGKDFEYPRVTDTLCLYCSKKCCCSSSVRITIRMNINDSGIQTDRYMVTDQSWTDLQCKEEPSLCNLGTYRPNTPPYSSPEQEVPGSDESNEVSMIRATCPIRSPDRHVILQDYSDIKDQAQALQYLEECHDGFQQYKDNIYQHRRAIEAKYHPIDCLHNQPQVTQGMRSILMEWLIKIHQKMELKFDTMFLSVSIVDRFLKVVPISRNCVHLLGITAVLISAKMNEIFPPMISELLRASNDPFTKEQVQKLELHVLAALKFDLVAPTSLFFIEYYTAGRMRSASLIGVPIEDVRKSCLIGRYLLELSFQDYMLSQFPPSLLALVVLNEADDLLCQKTHLGALQVHGHKQEVFRECVAEVRCLVDGLLENGIDLDVIYEKYGNVYDEQDT